MCVCGWSLLPWAKSLVSGCVSISLFLCAFWNIASENGDGNAEILKLCKKKKKKSFFHLLEVVFYLCKKQDMSRLGGGSTFAK